MEIGKMDDFSLSDLAGSTAIILASCGGLLTVILASRCECDLNMCWIWRCHRKPPPDPSEDASVDIVPPKIVHRKSTDTDVEQPALESEPEPEPQPELQP